ncbi:gp3.8 [Yersinia phage Yep-phi]|uniref:Uncharacterized protein n=2 Tax=unclassified Berlinvirus TaxID=2745901 RepID=B3VCJ1_9CAUD|nr:unknown product [Yersinia phage Yepe2]YP_009014836.1 gp3.8 [Yersinia phage Yep-phi]ACF15696.1 unknown product [Yersinia phage Yepe2]ADQ83169.1 gp3.8 [Yersinia phage Yep-phi]
MYNLKEHVFVILICVLIIGGACLRPFL